MDSLLSLALSLALLLGVGGLIRNIVLGIAANLLTPFTKRRFADIRKALSSRFGDQPVGEKPSRVEDDPFRAQLLVTLLIGEMGLTLLVGGLQFLGVLGICFLILVLDSPDWLRAAAIGVVLALGLGAIVVGAMLQKAFAKLGALTGK